jgi:hypothetical protein
VNAAAAQQHYEWLGISPWTDFAHISIAQVSIPASDVSSSTYR